MALAGIDYSLCGPCVCVFDGTEDDKFNIKRCAFYYLTSVKKQAKVFGTNIYGELFEEYNSESERFGSIADWAVDKVSGCDHIGLEGYAFGASGRALFQIAENCGLLKYKLYELAKPVEVIPPTVVKKFATGKGNASKQEMVDMFHTKTTVDLMQLVTPDKKTVGNPITDIADSYFICWKLHHTLRLKKRTIG